jgi:DNA-binding LacI/PurR family transcriptional regulator
MSTIKDIAAACGVSIATVSKALNGHDDVAEKTKRMVKDTAKALGYTPNSWARALKTNCTYNLGVLFADKAGTGLTHFYFSGILNSFKGYAESCGYDVTFVGSKFGNVNMTYLEHCKCRGFDGLFICCVDDFEDEQITELFLDRLPMVSLDFRREGKPAVFSDNRRGMQELVRFAYSRGHKNIAYICGDEAAVTTERKESYLDTMKSLSLKTPDDYLVSGRYLDTTSTYAATEKLLDLPNPPTCILMPDDFAALGGIQAITNRGLKIPDDISVIGYDGISLSDVLLPKLTTYKQDAFTIGRIAARNLISFIDDRRDTGIQLVDGSFIEGGTVKLLYDAS